MTIFTESHDLKMDCPSRDNRPSRRITVPKRYGCYERLSGSEEVDDEDDFYFHKRRRRRRKARTAVHFHSKVPGKSIGSSEDQNGPDTDLYLSLDSSTLSSSDLHDDNGNEDKEGKPKYGANAFVCSECGKVLRSKLTLMRHTISHSGSKPFVCSICKRGFSSAVALKEHKARHENKMLYECTICCKSFRQNSCYRRHLLTHSQSYHHVCPICERRFVRKDYLRSHMKMHGAEKRYQCSQCNKAFARLSDLNRHKILHTGKRPYKCDLCGMSFADGSSCRRHIKDHNSTPVRPFSCEHCSSVFRKPALLKQHLMKKHKIALPDMPAPPPPNNHEADDPTGVVPPSGNFQDSSSLVNESDLGSAHGPPELSPPSEEMPSTDIELSHQNSGENPPAHLIFLPADARLQVEKDLSCQEFIASGQFQQTKVSLTEAIDYGNLFASDIQSVDFPQIPNPGSSTFQDISPTIQDAGCVGMSEIFCTDLQQQVPSVASGYVVQEEPAQNPSHVDYISCPDFNSQAYYEWLSDFTALCKLLSYPIEPDLFNKISQVHKSIADVLAEPPGFLSSKENFKILRSISQDLLQVTNGHLNFIYEHLQE